MKYLSLDIETGGISPETSVLEVAFVMEDTAHPEVPVVDLPFSRVLFCPDPLVIEPYAFGMHTRNGLLADCMSHGLATENAWSLVSEVLLSYRIGSLGVGKKIVLAGKNVTGFDLRFFPEDIKRLFHYRTLDPGSMWVPEGTDAPLGTAELLEECGLAYSGSHRALDDARDVIRIIRTLREKYVDAS